MSGIRWGQGPRTFEQYEREVMDYARDHASVEDMRRALKASGFRGYSKMNRAALADAIAADDAARGELDRILHESRVHYRWVVAMGVTTSYAKLADIEAAAGVIPDMRFKRRGVYASWEDVRKVYEAASSGEAEGRVYARVRVNSIDKRALVAAISALRAAGASVSDPGIGEGWDDGTTTWYMDVALDDPSTSDHAPSLPRVDFDTPGVIRTEMRDGTAILPREWADDDDGEYRVE